MTTKTEMLPAPKGWKLLCMVPDVEETFEGSALIRPETVRNQEEHATTVLKVLAVGPLAYTGEKFGNSGAWCRVGDHVLVRTYSGTRFKVDGKEYRLLNDDQIEATVPDPRFVTRIGG